MQRRRFVSCLSLFAWGASTLGPSAARGGDAPPLMLANVYQPGITPLGDYWVSEKYDGVRGYWDGRQLLTRGGERIHAPDWFTAGWPTVPMDGELWAGREKFSHAVSTVRQQTPDDAAWRAMRFMVFDLPAHGGPFTERITAYRQLLAQRAVPWVQPVPQHQVASHAALHALLRQTVKAGGEGVMLHRGASLYRAARSDDLLKFKPFDDAEGQVIGHLPGRGKHAGRLGALVVQTRGGQRLRLGTGFTDAQRAHPPAVGVWVTFRHRGVTDQGIPRFASFLRVREDWAPNAQPAQK